MNYLQISFQITGKNPKSEIQSLLGELGIDGDVRVVKVAHYDAGGGFHENAIIKVTNHVEFPLFATLIKGLSKMFGSAIKLEISGRDKMSMTVRDVSEIPAVEQIIKSFFEASTPKPDGSGGESDFDAAEQLPDPESK